MAPEGCACEALASQRDARAQHWRELCTQFYVDQDARAKRVLDYFESSKVDQISVITADTSTGAPAGEEEEEERLTQSVSFLGLRKCMQPGHEEYFNDTIQMLEVVKNQVRAGFHADVAQRKFSEFDAMVTQTQGTNYNIKVDDGGRQRLLLRVRHDYLRPVEAQSQMLQRVNAFVKTHAANIGCHPFLAGLHAVFQWNLESSSVVAWRLSDAVIVESGGPKFAGEVLELLVSVLNFSHCPSEQQDEASHPENAATVILCREWHLDPYLSDSDLRELMRCFPPARKLEGRPTGDKRPTDTSRVNTHGQYDEQQPFFNRWYVVL